MCAKYMRVNVIDCCSDGDVGAGNNSNGSGFSVFSFFAHSFRIPHSRRSVQFNFSQSAKAMRQPQHLAFDGNGNAIGRSISGNLTFSPAITRYHIKSSVFRALTPPALRLRHRHFWRWMARPMEHFVNQMSNPQTDAACLSNLFNFSPTTLMQSRHSCSGRTESDIDSDFIESENNSIIFKGGRIIGSSHLVKNQHCGDGQYVLMGVSVAH